MRIFTIRGILPLMASLLAISVAAPAGAACFESGVGCTNTAYMPLTALRALSCDALWTVRNTIFHENGYCFQTARGRAAFDNAYCRYASSAAVPLNAFERTNVDRIVRVEREKGC